MTAKRFTIDNDINFDDKVETYELNCINDNENKTFYFIADSIENVQLFVKRLNELLEENEQLQEKLKKYEEIEELKKEGFINCHNCKNDRSVHDGVALDGMCAIDELMNLDGYFDTKYHKLPSKTICPCWELEE